MEKRLFILLVGFVINQSISAQISMKALEHFVEGRKIIDTLGPGLKHDSEDILIVLSAVEEDENENLMLLRNTKGKLTKIAENEGLQMNPNMLGVTGSNYPSFYNNTIFVNYTLGSNSATSDVSIQFEKSDDGNYYFKEYTSKTNNFGVENLFERLKISSSQTGQIKFSDATENDILNKSKVNQLPENSAEPLYVAANRFAKYIPEDWRLAAFSEGDLNLDDFKKDLLLIFYNEENCRIQLLLQQKDGSYKEVSENTNLIVADETFNINNFKAIIKNGYFTIEQRIATDDADFDHSYITFKYELKTQNWFLHRYDVEHFTGFNTKPSQTVTHLTKVDFGTISFENLDATPKN